MNSWLASVKVREESGYETGVLMFSASFSSRVVVTLVTTDGEEQVLGSVHVDEFRLAAAGILAQLRERAALLADI